MTLRPSQTDALGTTWAKFRQVVHCYAAQLATNDEVFAAADAYALAILDTPLVSYCQNCKRWVKKGNCGYCDGWFALRDRLKEKKLN